MCAQRPLRFMTSGPPPADGESTTAPPLRRGLSTPSERKNTTMTLSAFASKIAAVLDTVTVTSADDGHELLDYADCYLALTGRVEGVSAAESMALFDGSEEVSPRTVRLLNEVFASAGDDSAELQRQLWDAASQGEWPEG